MQGIGFHSSCSCHHDGEVRGRKVTLYDEMLCWVFCQLLLILLDTECCIRERHNDFARHFIKWKPTTAAIKKCSAKKARASETHHHLHIATGSDHIRKAEQEHSLGNAEDTALVVEKKEITAHQISKLHLYSKYRISPQTFPSEQCTRKHTRKKK